jgi:hypothetical protein
VLRVGVRAAGPSGIAAGAARAVPGRDAERLSAKIRGQLPAMQGSIRDTEQKAQNYSPYARPAIILECNLATRNEGFGIFGKSFDTLNTPANVLLSFAQFERR